MNTIIETCKTIKFEDAVEKLEDAMLKARKNYVKSMFYIDNRIEINNTSYIRIPCTESYVETNDYGIIKTEKLGAFITDISGYRYVEIEYGYINKEISYVDNEYIKNSEIKIA
jgi:hypothetical protein